MRDPQQSPRHYGPLPLWPVRGDRRLALSPQPTRPLKGRQLAHRFAIRLIIIAIVCSLWGSPGVAGDEGFTSSGKESRRSLPLPARAAATDTQDERRTSRQTTAVNLTSLAVTLGLIVGTLLLAGRGLKWSGFRPPHQLPDDALELLGRRNLEPRISVSLVKCGSRILLLGISPEGVRTLSEIDEPAEVQRLLDACQNPGGPERKRAASTSAGRNSGLVSMAGRSLLFLTATTLSLGFSTTCEAQANRPATNVRRQQHPAAIQPVAAAAVDLKRSRTENHDPLEAEVDPPLMLTPQQLGLSFKMLAMMSVFSLAPSLLMMTTCYVRFSVVLGLLRQALGTQQGPSNQVLTAICLFLTFLVMSPVWQRCYQDGIRPYTNPAADEQPIDEATALKRTVAPVRAFMSQQIDRANNGDAVWMLIDFQRSGSESNSSNQWEEPESYDDVPLTVLAPAYLLSELKVGFLIGFQLFLPFLVIDLVVALILASLGLTMMPPSMVSLPFKLLLFVMIDGWFLTVGMLLESVRTL